MFKTLPEVAVRIARSGLIAALLVVATDAAAQAYSPAAFQPISEATPHQFGLASSAVESLVRENEMDLRALDAFGRKPRTGRVHAPDRSGPWTIYGRIGFMNMVNKLDGDSAGTQFSLQRTGPGLGGKVYIGIHRRF